MLKVCPECGIEWDDEEEGGVCPECNQDAGFGFDVGSYEDHFRGDR
jgi:anaerobic ribonucleoside-triphosphate reductase